MVLAVASTMGTLVVRCLEFEAELTVEHQISAMFARFRLIILCTRPAHPGSHKGFEGIARG
jgi:hypothetical protein